MHMLSMRPLVLCPLLSLGSLASMAHAATINVPGGQPTIQTAINSAAPTGDVIIVAPGTYIESLDYNGKAVVIQSANGPAVTTINGVGISVVQFHTGEGRGSVLQGFTLTNGGTPDYGGGIFISNASPTITGNIIQGNWAGAGGGGIAILGGSPLVTNNIIRQNGQGGGYSGGTGGGGILVQWTSGAEISFNSITNNTWSQGGGLSLFSAGSPFIHHNIITDNIATGCSPECYGGGIAIAGGTAHIVGNLITRNSAGAGGGIYNSVPSGSPGSRFVSNTIVFNIGSGSEAASDVMNEGFYSQSAFVNNVIVSNNGGIAFYCSSTYSSTPPIQQNNDIAATNSRTYGGVCGPIPANPSVDPAFVNVATGDFHLTFGSPMIDAGVNTDQDISSTDLDQHTRIVDGDGNGTATIDIGAYEVQNPLLSAGDSSLIQSTPATNEGSNTLLYLGAGQHTVVSFNIAAIPSGKLTHATLQLTFAQPAVNWGPHGNPASVYNLSTPFAEGNGFVLGATTPTPGSGSGTTWYCPTDTNISNQTADCVSQWNGANAIIGNPTATVTILTGQTGVVSFDVTTDVLNAIANKQTTVQWMLRRTNENKQGQATFFSKEAATGQQNPGIGPGLRLQF